MRCTAQKKGPVDVHVGDLLLNFTPYFKLYTNYINNFVSVGAFMARVVKEHRKKASVARRAIRLCCVDAGAGEGA